MSATVCTLSNGAPDVPVQFQSDQTILITNLAPSRLHDILQ